MSPMLVPVIVLGLGMYLYFSLLGATGTTFGMVSATRCASSPSSGFPGRVRIRQLDPAHRVRGHDDGREPHCAVLPRSSCRSSVPSILAGALFAFLISFDEVVIAWFLSDRRPRRCRSRCTAHPLGSLTRIAAVSTLLTALSFFVCLVTVALQPGTARPGAVAERLRPIRRRCPHDQ